MRGEPVCVCVCVARFRAVISQTKSDTINAYIWLSVL